MIKALFYLGALWWGFPIVAFAITALLIGKPHVFLAITALTFCSIIGGALGAAIAAIMDEDVFEFCVFGALIGILAGGYPVAYIFL